MTTMCFLRRDLPGLIAALILVASGCGGPQAPLTSANSGQRHTVIRGTLLGHDGKPMQVAHVHSGTQMIEVGADGSFTVTVQEPGFHILRLTGASHREDSAGIYSEGTDITIHARLGTYDRQEPPKHVDLVVMEPIYDERSSVVIQAMPMAPQPDGSFVAEFPHNGPELFYQLGNVAVYRRVNGTQSDGYVYDGGGDYMSRVSVTGGKAVIRFDPTKQQPPGLAGTIQVLSPSSRTEAIARIHADIQLRRRAYDQMIRQALAAAGEGADSPGIPLPAPASADLSWRSDIVRRLGSEQDAEIRNALFIAYFASSFGLDSRAPDTKRLADQALARVPASSALWNIAPTALSVVIQSSTSPGSHRHYVEEVIQHLDDHQVAGDLVFGQLVYADEEERKDDVIRYYRMLTGQFADTQAASMAMMYSPDRKLRKGKPMPDFTWPAFGQETKQHSLASFRGTAVLVDFWATWCTPCTAEMPVLHQAYEAYREKGFTILSVAVADDPNAVRKFREKWPMPWNHVVLTPEQSDQVSKEFGLVGLPVAVLLDRKGHILVTNTTLRGENLMRTLESVIHAEIAH